MVKYKLFPVKIAAMRSPCAKYGDTGVIIFLIDNSVNHPDDVPEKTCKMLFPVFNVTFVCIKMQQVLHCDQHFVHRYPGIVYAE